MTYTQATLVITLLVLGVIGQIGVWVVMLAVVRVMVDRGSQSTSTAQTQLTVARGSRREKETYYGPG